MKVSLNLTERMKLFNLIKDDPKFKETTIATWKIIDIAKKDLGLGEEDYKIFKLVTRDGTLYAEDVAKAAEDIEYTIPDTLYALIVSHLKEKNDAGKVNEDLYTLWKKLVKEDDVSSK